MGSLRLDGATLLTLEDHLALLQSHSGDGLLGGVASWHRTLRKKERVFNRGASK